MTNEKNPNKVVKITSQQAAFIISKAGYDCSNDKITRWCRNGVLKKTKQIGRQWYVSEAEVLRLIQDEE